MNSQPAGLGGHQDMQSVWPPEWVPRVSGPIARIAMATARVEVEPDRLGLEALLLVSSIQIRLLTLGSLRPVTGQNSVLLGLDYAQSVIAQSQPWSLSNPEQSLGARETDP